MDFVEWAGRWTLSPPGEMAATALKGLRAPRPKPERRVRRVGDRQPARATPARTGVLEALGESAILGAIARVLRSDPAAQILILLPESALTQALIERITARFGAAPAEWHSGVAPPRRRQVGEAVVAGRCNIVVGARSALFLPFVDLRLIVVDEEHDSSFKQEEGLVYHGRDLAVARAGNEGAAVVLASASPSLEPLLNGQAGRYDWVRLGARHGVAVMPAIELLVLRQHTPDPQTWLSQPLRTAVAA